MLPQSSSLTVAAVFYIMTSKHFEISVIFAAKHFEVFVIFASKHFEVYDKISIFAIKYMGYGRYNI